MTKDHLRFCLKRPDKALHARQLRLTVMIDDRVDVLQHLEGFVGQRLLFGEQSRRARSRFDLVMTRVTAAYRPTVHPR